MDQMTDDASKPDPIVQEIRFEYTPVLPDILNHLNASLLVTTYQAGKLLVLGTSGKQMKVSLVNYEQPMGIGVDTDRIAIGSKRQIHFLVAAHETATGLSPVGTYDGCFVPRSSFSTGAIHGHDLAWGRDGLWVVNTLFSCLCTLHDGFSFVPRWRPRFITELIDQDRCHLNGLAMVHGVPRFVTVLAESNEPAGWRPTKATSGAIIDVASGETVARGLSMPHSPRLHGNRFWVLNSGRGALSMVDLPSGKVETVEQFPGYTRGLTFSGQFAFVGLSKIRETAVFGGVPIAEHRENLKCGVAVFDMASGRSVAAFQFLTGVSEIFAVEIVPNLACPYIPGSASESNDRDVWIVPSPQMAPPKNEPTLPIYARPLSHSVANVPDLIQRGQWAHRQGRLTDAATHLEEAVDRLRAAVTMADDKPRKAKLASALVDLGNLRQDQQLPLDALALYEEALIFDPECLAARQNLGYLCANRGDCEAAMSHYEELVRLAPTPLNQLLLATTLPVVYESSDALARWRERQLGVLRGMVASDIHVEAVERPLPTSFYWAYQGANDREVMTARGRIIQGVVATLQLDAASLQRRRQARADGRWRIGLVSAYLRDHTIGRLNVGRVEKLDRRQFHLSLLGPYRKEDAIQKRFVAAVDRFAPLPPDLETARKLLLEWDLDLLLFPDVGMDPLVSTLAFSRVAPVQCATWGHPDTTGSSTIDYFLSSELLEGANAQSHYTETLVLGKRLGVWYERPQVGALNSLATALGLSPDRHWYVCPQTTFKFHPDFDTILAKILSEDPAGELLVMSGNTANWTTLLRNRWEQTLGKDVNRVRFLSPLPRPDFLRLLAIAPVVLDPLPFGGGNSSYEALGVGTPVVTCPSEFLRGRITQALYRAMDLDGDNSLVVATSDEYVAQSVRLASDPSYRRTCSENIRSRSSSLFENLDEVRDFEQTLLACLEQ